MKNKYVWCLGAGLMQVPVVEEIWNLGYSVIVSDGNDSAPCIDILRENDIFEHIDIFDIENHINALIKLQQPGGIDVAGTVCIGIDCPETAAAMQEYLGKPTAPRDVARICHNKAEFRKAMKVLGYPTPTVTDKLIVKTKTESSGSRGTVLYPDCGYLIEQRWEGTEHTVETLFDVNGKFWPCFITDRFFNYSRGFALETGLRHPSTLPSYIQRKAYQIAEELGRDLGINHGPFKLDIIVTEDGVRVIEATTRFSGGFDCQYLVPAATGKNILRAGIFTAIGEPICSIFGNPTHHRWNKVALSESLWPPVGKIVDIQGVEEAKKIEGVEHIIFRKNVGDIVEDYVDCTKRVCFIITSGNTEPEAWEAMDKAQNNIRIVIE